VVVYEAILREGKDELTRPWSALAWSGLAAGLSMGFSMVAEGLLTVALPDAPWRPLISKFGYSVGFLIVVLGRQQLFTENTLTPILPFLRDRKFATLREVGRLWGVVLVANLVGAFLFGAIVSWTHIFAPDTHAAFRAIGAGLHEAEFGTTFTRAVFAGWLIALMVWLLPFAETARVTVIIILTYLIGLGGFNHIIAGSVEAFYQLVQGEVAPGAMLWGFFLPTLLGNILGGLALVTAVNHAQVVSGSGIDA
jgi:formate/nitrite transporter FocA (FNT family)